MPSCGKLSVTGPGGSRAGVAVADYFQDVVVASFYDNMIAWYENVGNAVSPTYFDTTQHIINGAAGYPTYFTFADLDLDGDLDCTWCFGACTTLFIP